MPHLKTPTEEMSMRIICSKSEVKLLKSRTMPRWELTEAVLPTKLISHVIQTLDINDIEIFLWTDSKVTLTWINNRPSRWKEFVHSRVGFIRETLPPAKWRFVAGYDNPTDLATRGLTPKQLAGNTMVEAHYGSRQGQTCDLLLHHFMESTILKERNTHVTTTKKGSISGN